MNKLIKKSAQLIREMKENTSDKDKETRKKDYLAWLRGERMSDEAKKLFVKDTVGDTSHLSQAKSIIKNAKKDQDFYDSIEKNKPKAKKDINELFKESKIISKINENIEDMVTSINHGYKDEIDKESNKKPKNRIDKESNSSMVQAPAGGEITQTGITESRIAYKKIIKEEEELQRQTLATGVESIRVKYAKGIIDSLKLYSDILPKAQAEYGMNDLAIQLQSHIMEDSEELEETISKLKKEDKEEAERYQKAITESLDEMAHMEDREFGLPEVKKYPMFNAEHVKSAAKLFDHGNITDNQRDELAAAIKRQARKYDVDLSFVTEKNGLYKYLNEEVAHDSFNNIEGGKADGLSIKDIASKHSVSTEVIQVQIDKGIEIELEHTDKKEVAMEIVMDHLTEFPDYYDRLDEMEREAKAEIKAKEDKEKIDLSDKLTKKEEKILSKEPSIEKKNELDPDKDNSEGTSDIMSKYFEGQIV